MNKQNLVKHILKINSSELNLENTFINGQCFNWKKLSNNRLIGIFREYFIYINRIDENTLELYS